MFHYVQEALLTVGLFVSSTLLVALAGECFRQAYRDIHRRNNDHN